MNPQKLERGVESLQRGRQPNVKASQYLGDISLEDFASACDALARLRKFFSGLQDPASRASVQAGQSRRFYDLALNQTVGALRGDRDDASELARSQTGQAASHAEALAGHTAEASHGLVGIDRQFAGLETTTRQVLGRLAFAQTDAANLSRAHTLAINAAIAVQHNS